MSSNLREMQFEQPGTFEFTKDNLAKAKQLIAKYPAGHQHAAVMPLLWLAQQQHDNWLPRAAMFYIADLLEMPPIKVLEVAHFYTMYNKQPVGRNLVQVCRTTPCWLRGSEEITDTCRAKLGIDVGETTVDGAFTLIEVECLGACVNAPVVQINDDYFEDLAPEDMAQILDELAQGDAPKHGSYSGRQCSAPLTQTASKAMTKPAVKPKAVRAVKGAANKSLQTASLDFGDDVGGGEGNKAKRAAPAKKGRKPK